MASSVPDANLSCPGTHIVERLPIGWLKPDLDLSQFETRFLPGIFWECQQIVVGGPYPTDLFFIVHTTGMYKVLYAPGERVKVLVKILGEQQFIRARRCQTNRPESSIVWDPR
jgi:hypothetical protein